MGEVQRGLENVEFATGIPNLLKGGFSEQVSTGVDVYSIRQPLGVVAGITPFNFPAMVPLWMCANAIACGNTFVLKPSEKDPGASLLIAELFKDAGLPDGVFNVIQGDKVVVDRILEHPDIRAVSFVGSTPIARYVYETGTRNGKRVQALGGAKNHMIVLPDADVDMAADAAVSAGYGSAGERCMAVSVVVAVGDVGDRIVERDPRPAAEDQARSGRRPRVRDGAARDEGAPRPRGVVPRLGARAGRDGGAPTAARTSGIGGEGFFLGVSLLDGVTAEMDCYRDEIFGPVLSVVRVDTYDEAVRLVNENPYGNGVAIFTRDGGAARTVPVRGRGGHGRRERPDPGAGRLLLVRRVEVLAVRGHAHVRARRRQLLHARQGRHLEVAGPRDERRGPRVPPDALTPVRSGGRRTRRHAAGGRRQCSRVHRLVVGAHVEHGEDVALARAPGARRPRPRGRGPR